MVLLLTHPGDINKKNSKKRERDRRKKRVINTLGYVKNNPLIINPNLNWSYKLRKLSKKMHTAN